MSDNPPQRPTIRIPAGSDRDRLGRLTTDQVTEVVSKLTHTSDSLQNFAARYGLGTGNLLSGSTYGFYPISRLQQLTEWAYRGSWIVGVGCDVVAEDMTRCGVQMNSETDPGDIEELLRAEQDLCLWQNLCDTIRWARLYGGCLMVMMVDGQNMEDELDPETVPEDGLKGFMPVDRWMVQPTFSDLVLDYGPDYGMPRYYDMIATAPYMPRQRIHYSRVLRMDGVTLPFRQRLAENGWGMSILERLYDRLLAFDSGTLGTAQLLFRAYVRVYKVKGYRAIMASDTPALAEKFLKSVEMMRMLQSNEGMSVIDSEDEVEALTYSFAGLADTLQLLGQQIAGALGIPMVRLFGQSPSGMNATGESDFRQYDYLINAQQESRLRRPLTRVYKVMWQSVLGRQPPDTWNFQFKSISELSEKEKAELAQRDCETVVAAHNAGIISTAMAMKELKQSSIITGRFTNITDEDIEDADEQPPPWEAQEGMPPGMGGAPGGPGGGQAGGMGAGMKMGGAGGVGVKLSSSPSGGNGGGFGGGGDSVPRSAAWHRRERTR
jgi:phage-related protein (TIGR01555 family)